jgi:eukaryotic-like serine/threonine-protein kinase
MLYQWARSSLIIVFCTGLCLLLLSGCGAGNVTDPNSLDPNNNTIPDPSNSNNNNNNNTNNNTTPDTPDPNDNTTPAGNTITVDCGNGVTMELVKILAGTFEMGTNSTDYDWLKYSRPVHQVTISKAFYMGKYEVTQAQYQAVMGNNPSYFSGAPNKPVESVSWSDAVAFCQALTTKSGHNIRLPSEAEWEYACKADNGSVDTKFYFGDDESQLGNYAWYYNNSDNTTHTVGTKIPNSFGLYDMAGNVWEWCNDWWGDYYYASSPSTDPPGPSSASANGGRVLRGSSWYINDLGGRSSLRVWIVPTGMNSDVGFRVVWGN